MTEHARLSASGAHRWMECPGSVHLEEGLPDVTTEYAEYGTAAHDLASEHLLNPKLQLEDSLGKKIKVGKKEIEVDQEMIDGVQVYLDYCRSYKGFWLVESRVCFDKWVPGGFGTGDFADIDFDCVTSVDLKFGKGVQVDAPKNPQGILYLLGILNTYSFLGNFKKLKIVIVQPRLDHISEWEISIEELLIWGEKIKEHAKAVEQEDPPFNPGEKQCKFCKAKSSCKALAEFNFSLAAEEFGVWTDDMETKDPRKLSNDEISFILKNSALFKDWLSSIDSLAFSKLNRGENIPDFKLVQGKSNRIWKNEKKAEKALKKFKLILTEIFTKKIISPAQAETLLKKKKFKKEQIKKLDSVINKPKGKITLASIKDKRPALEPEIFTDFKVIEEETY